MCGKLVSTAEEGGNHSCSTFAASLEVLRADIWLLMVLMEGESLIETEFTTCRYALVEVLHKVWTSCVTPAYISPIEDKSVDCCHKCKERGRRGDKFLDLL